MSWISDILWENSLYFIDQLPYIIEYNNKSLRLLIIAVSEIIKNEKKDYPQNKFV